MDSGKDPHSDKVEGMAKQMRRGGPPPPDPHFAKDWREQIKARLAAQVEAGGTLYGVRADGAYVARTKHGERVIAPAKRDSE